MCACGESESLRGLHQEAALSSIELTGLGHVPLAEPGIDAAGTGELAFTCLFYPAPDVGTLLTGAGRRSQVQQRPLREQRHVDMHINSIQ